MGDKAGKEEPSGSSRKKPDELTTPLTRKDLQYLSSEMKDEWQNVGRNLHITEGQLYKFTSDHGRREEEVIYQMLLHWQQKEASKATRKTLAKALREANSTALADFVLTGVKPKSPS